MIRAVLGLGGSTIGKIPGPQLHRRTAAPGIGEGGQLAEMGRQRPRGVAQPAARASTTRTRSPCTAAMAESTRSLRSRLFGLIGRSKRAGLARSTILRSIARQDQHAFGKLGVGRNGVEELGPLGGAASIGDVAADQDGVERIARMQLVELASAASRSLPRGPDRPLSMRKP